MKNYKSFWVIRCVNCLTFNVAFLVIGIVLWKGDISEYGQVIEYETKEWSDGPIIDIQSVSGTQACPGDFKKVSGTFWGT